VWYVTNLRELVAGAVDPGGDAILKVYDSEIAVVIHWSFYSEFVLHFRKILRVSAGCSYDLQERWCHGRNYNLGIQQVGQMGERCFFEPQSRDQKNLVSL
jgi:hypothetical protein